ncbi:MAG: hypothetical protein ACOYJK_11280 [Prevotella sp.]|jgi:hypothetical protein
MPSRNRVLAVSEVERGRESWCKNELPFFCLSLSDRPEKKAPCFCLGFHLKKSENDACGAVVIYSPDG